MKNRNTTTQNQSTVDPELSSVLAADGLTEVETGTETAITEPSTFENGKSIPSKIGTTELAEVIRLRKSLEVTTKRLRITLRKLFPDAEYTKYVFQYPSPTVDAIVDQVATDLEAIENRKQLVAERTKAEKVERPVLTLTKNN